MDIKVTVAVFLGYADFFWVCQTTRFVLQCVIHQFDFSEAHARGHTHIYISSSLLLLLLFLSAFTSCAQLNLCSGEVLELPGACWSEFLKKVRIYLLQMISSSLRFKSGSILYWVWVRDRTSTEVDSWVKLKNNSWAIGTGGRPEVREETNRVLESGIISWCAYMQSLQY
jgi:hypothetical protein